MPIRANQGDRPSFRSHRAVFTSQPELVHGGNLIEQDQTPPVTMSDADPKRRLAIGRIHRCDERRAQSIVLIGG